MTKAELPSFVGEIGRKVESELARLIDHEAESWTVDHPDLSVPFEELRSLVLGGGKRIRPAFCVLGSLAAGGVDQDSSDGPIIRVGAALEMLHAMALFHDDVIDASFSRRGRETTHVRHSRLHRENSWAGDATRFGDGVAILIGDLAYVYADQLMEPMSPRVRAVWTKMRLEVNIGQYLDVVGSARRDFSTDAAGRIALFKTAKYTVERPLHLGALVADPNAPQSLIDALSGYGVALGVAFQMRDDVLGVFGEPNTTGKPAGDDLRESKPTALVATAYTRSTETQRRILDRIGDPKIDASLIEEIRGVITESGALEETESRIAELTNAAVSSLGGVELSTDVREKFLSLAHAVAWRNV